MSTLHIRFRFPLMAPMLAIAALMLTATMLVGCSATEVLHTWTSPTFTGPAFRKVLVVGVGFRPAVRWTCEDSFARELQNRGAQGVASYTLLDEEGTVNKAAILKAAAEAGADAVLVTQFVQSFMEPVYVPTGADEDPDAPWPLGRTPVTGPQVAGQNQIVILKIMIFRADNAQRVWSGGTKTYDAASLERAMDSISETITKELLEEKIVGPQVAQTQL